MGIPRFYRWLSERYPLINENISAEQIPDIDNLYLDMNGIIHTCSHNNTGGLCVKDESDVFVEVFNYIVRLCHLIKPRRLLYLAVDGCAPRAKMNQQRSRRFRAANDAREAREKAELMGETISGVPFDSNCITPGTEFMGRLSEHLRFFVQKRVHEDPLWQGLEVVLSSPDVPGEGEHKIMDYIRTAKSQPGYCPNLRHCLYGLDADLIMLALVAHEPHFALLREEVLFGSRQTKQPEQRLLTAPERFQLLHISLLREYLEQEFASSLPQLFELERLVDDFVLFCVLVGNDFLPCLPFAEIGEGGLDAMFSVYKRHLEAAAGEPWLTSDCGQVRSEQFLAFLQLYSEWEQQQLASAVDNGWVLGQRRRVGPSGPDSAPEAQEPAPELPHCAEEGRELYYSAKFGVELDSEAGAQELRSLLREYLQGLQWVLHYYFRGPDGASWSWYYRFYHAPFAMDLVGYDGPPAAALEVGGPFLPFQQLMAVLPANSKALLPECYQWLFDAPESPVTHFYPPNFELDLDGVKVPWGGVALIPWIEPAALLAAMEQAELRGPALSDAEQKRNQFGQARCFRHERGLSARVPSSIPQRFADLQCCDVGARDFKHPALPPGVAHFPNWLLESGRAKDFPSLALHPLTCSLGTGIKVFQQAARGQSLVVHLRPQGPMLPPEQAILDLLKAQDASVDYPMIHHGKVVAVHTHRTSYLADGRRLRNDPSEHEELVGTLTEDWRKRGLEVEFDDDDPAQQPLAEVKLADASHPGRFRPTVERRLLHLVNKLEPTSAPPALAERLPAGSIVLCLDRASTAFGVVGFMEQVGGKLQGHFKSGPTRAEQEELQAELWQIVARQQATLRWWNLPETARLAGLDLHSARQALMSVLARDGNNVREDVGMNLMCEMWDEGGGGTQLCLPTYSVRWEGAWWFSDLAVEALREYSRQYPGLFKLLRDRKPRDRDVELRLAFPGHADPEYAAAKLVKYCTRQPFKKLRLVSKPHMALAAPAVAEVVDAVARARAKPRRDRSELVAAGFHRPQDPLPPELAYTPVDVGQRGVYARLRGPVELGTMATVLGVYGTGEEQLLELLLDSERFGATDLHSRTPPLRGLQVPREAFLPLLPAAPTQQQADHLAAATLPPRGRWAKTEAAGKQDVSHCPAPRPAAAGANGGAALDDDEHWARVFGELLDLGNRRPQGSVSVPR